MTDTSNGGGDGSSDDCVLAIDLGTGGPKVGFVTVSGELLWHETTTVTTHRPGVHGAVQRAEDWWEAITGSIADGLASGMVRRSSIVAVSITGQYASTVPVDGAGDPVGDCLLWMDTRGGELARRRFGGHAAGYDTRTVTAWVRRSGGAPALSGADPIGHRLFLQAEQPEVSGAARWLMEPIDQLTMRFTGVAVASPASMAAAWLVDTRKPGQTDYDIDLVRRSGVVARQLPPLVRSGSVIGEVLPQVADRLGLPQHVKVVAALPDLHTAAIGSGAVGEHRAHLAISTSSWISAPVRSKKTDVFHQVATVPGITPDGYLVIDNHEVGGLALDWFRTRVLADGDTAPPPEAVTALAATAAPGSGNVLFTPWLNGERSPVEDPLARGGFHNLSLSSGRAEMARAVLEGVAFNSRWLGDAVEKFTASRLDPIRVIGGGAQSDLWCQIHADVMNRTIERPAEPVFANLRGAALSAAMALGRVELTDIAGLVPVETTFTPDPANRAVYDPLYAEFPKRYRADKAMFHHLNAD